MPDHIPDKEMRGNSFWARLAAVCRRLVVQRVIVVMVLAAAAYLQYYLVNVPIADLSQTTKFSPATVKASEQMVSFKNPETEAGKFDFGFDQPAESQKQRMMVDAYFDRAALSDATLRTLAALDVHAPAEAAAITYLTSDEPNVRCNTAVRVQTLSIPTSGGPTSGRPASMNPGQTRAAEFSQSQLASSNRYRVLEMKMKGLDSTVTLSSQGTFGEAILSASSCKLTLQVGNWRQVMQGFVPIVVTVPPGSGYRLHWEEANAKTSGWNASGPALPLLSFGTAHRQSFRAEEIAVLPAQASEAAKTNDGLVARAERKDAPLTVDALLIGTDHFQFGASGKGMVRENGSAVVTANLLETINKYPLIAGLFAAANLGLLNWAKRRFFPPARVTPADVVPFPRENSERARLGDQARGDDKAASG
jgi:hypothetical protein